MHVHMAAMTTMARPRGTTTTILVLLLLVALAGAADQASAAAFGSEDDQNTAAALLPSSAPYPAAGGDVDAGELNGMIQCVMGCFTQVFGCALGCMGKGPDLPLCIISCDSKSVVCMIRCGLTPSPPGPKPPGPTPPGPKPKPPPPSPKPPAPKPPAPKPPPPGPPYTPPYAVAGSRKTGTYA